MRSQQQISESHKKRDAYLYVRQATVNQGTASRENLRRQYALGERAVTLGWPRERIQVIDRDLGQSGASAEGREGYQQLIDAVRMGRAGIVLGLDVSRFTRNHDEWYRLIKICARRNTLIADEEKVYAPSDFSDSFLLGPQNGRSTSRVAGMLADRTGDQFWEETA